jgi:RNA polymerase sporulation-specific sigma factor
MDNLELLKRAQEGDKEAFEEFYKENQKLVYSLMKRYNVQKSEYEDVLGDANYGLLMAISKFDFSYGVSFSTYAVPLILGEIKRHFRDSSLLRVSRSKKELYLKIQKAIDELEGKLLRSPTLEEISSFINEPKEDIIESLDSNNRVFSLDENMNEDSESSILSNVEDKSNNLFDKMDIRLALEKLSKKEQLIIKLRYFEGYSQTEVSERLNYSQVQISRLESKILEKMKELI